MKTILAFIVLAVATSASAATFKSLPELSRPVIANLADVTGSILAKNGGIYGDASAINAYAYTKKSSERDINTVKQLLMKKGLANTEDLNHVTTAHPFKTKELALSTLVLNGELNHLDEDDQKKVSADAEKLTAALNITATSGVRFFTAGHADEDGTWNLLIILDQENQEVLVLSFGFRGT